MDDVDDLDRALGTLRHDRHGFYGALGRDAMLQTLSPAGGNLPPRVYRLLRFIDAQPAGTVTVGQVAEVLLCDLARASRIVHRMVDDGLVVLRVPAHDTRQRRIELAPPGRRIVAAAAQRRRHHLRAAVADWSPDDVRTLVRLLDRFARVSPTAPGAAG